MSWKRDKIHHFFLYLKDDQNFRLDLRADLFYRDSLFVVKQPMTVKLWLLGELSGLSRMNYPILDKYFVKMTDGGHKLSSIYYKSNLTFGENSYCINFLFSNIFSLVLNFSFEAMFYEKKVIQRKWFLKS